MSSTPKPLLNPLTDAPFNGIRDMERVVAGLAGSYIEDPNFHIVEDSKLREHQLTALNRGFGYAALTPANLDATPNQESSNVGPMIHVLNVSDNPVGETRDNVLRLTEQGQATLADGSTSDLERFARIHPTWRPSSISERNTALNGLRGKLNKSSTASLDAVERVINDGNKWLEEAHAEEQALKIDETLAEMELHDKATFIRTNETVMSAIIAIRLNSHIFEKGKIVQKNKAPYTKLMSEVTNEVLELDDAQLVYMWDTALESAMSRRRFWEDQVAEASKDPRVEMAKRDRLQRAQQ